MFQERTIKQKKEFDTMNTKKMTKRDYFTDILSKYDLTADEKAFIEHELELLARKNMTPNGEKKLTAAQLENEKLKEAILVNMEPNRLYSISEMMKEFECISGLTLPKVSALITQLKNVGKVIRVEEKRKAYFKRAD